MRPNARKNTQAVPAPVGVKDTQVQRILWAMKEKLDLIFSDTLSIPSIDQLRRRISGLEAASGVGVDPITPNVVTGLEATGTFSFIIVTFDGVPASTSYVEIFANTDDDMGTAVLVGVTPGEIFSHDVGINQSRYYWARAVSTSNPPIRSAFNATAGTFAQTALIDGEFIEPFTVGTAQIDQAAITTAKLVNLAVDNAKLANLAVSAAKLADSSVDLAGNKITGQLAGINLADAAVDTSKLANLSVEAAKLAGSSVTSTKIASLAVGSAAIANAAITNAKIANLAVDTAQIATAAISSAKIENLAVGTAAIAALAVGSAQIANAAIVSAKIGDAQITNAKIQDASISAAKIANATITSAQIKDATIVSAKVKSIGADKIVAQSLSAFSANLGTVTSGTMRTSSGNGARTEISSLGSYSIWSGSGAKSAANANFYVDTNGLLKINQLDVIDTAQIKDAAIDTAKIQDLAIETLKLRDQAVTFAVSTFSSAVININTTDTSVGQLTTSSTGARTTIMFSTTLLLSFLASGGVNEYNIKIMRNGLTDILSNSLVATVTKLDNVWNSNDTTIEINGMGAISINVVDAAPPAGNNTYEVFLNKLNGRSSADAKNRGLFVTEVKK